jgi:tetratricopeptide (TPR) repeat protein
LNPEQPLLYFSRGKSLLALKDFDAAIADFDKAIELHKTGKIEDYFFERGIAHLEKKEYDKAIGDWTEVINLDPKSHGAYHNRAVAYAQMGRKDLAEMDFAKERELKFNK